LGAGAISGLLYQPRIIGEGDCGEIGGMKIGRGNRSTRRKPPSVFKLEALSLSRHLAGYRVRELILNILI
jgi:hypothetical protein